MQATDEIPQMSIPRRIIVIDSAQILGAWQWWLQNITARPDLRTGDSFIFDHKKWGEALTCLIHNDSVHISYIANLYLTSQIAADPNEILEIIQGQSIDIGVSEAGFDPQIKKIMESPENFRYALSENLAFWAQLASIIKLGLFTRFVVTLPNTKPTDPGPDGISLSFDRNDCPIVEIRSIKSSIHDPSGKIASANFRRGINLDLSAPPDTQLDEFYLVINVGYGFTKLERLLVSAFHSLNIKSDNALRIGLLRNQSHFNAIIVADNQYARSDRFDIYSRISRLSTEKIATYIGSDDWETLSEQTRKVVINILTASGVY